MTSRRRSAQAVLALAVLAALLVWTVARFERAREPAVEPIVSVARAPTEASDELPPAGGHGARRAEVLEADEPAFDAGPFAPEPADGVALSILAAQGGAPAERAVVRIARRAPPAGAGRARLREIAADGERYLAGWDGALRVPRAERALLLTAETSDGFAWAELQPAAEKLELELEPCPSLRVRVLDAEGRPAAGVPVAMQRKPGADSHAYARATTGRDGVATFRDALLALAQAGEEALAVVELPLVHPPLAALAPAPLPAEPLELRLPACGSLEVRVLDADGEPVRGERNTLSLYALPRARAETPGEADPKRPQRLARADLDAGAAVRFPCVELGRRFGLHFDGGDEESEEPFELDGPTKPGELVTLDFAPYAAMHFVTGRALDAEGRPLRALALEAAVLRELSSGAVRRSTERLASDAEGRFRVQVGERAQAVKATRLELHTRGDPGLGAVCDVPLLLERGGSDLGDLVLEAERSLVAGTVRDERGMELAGVRLGLSERTGMWRQPGSDPSQQEEVLRVLGDGSARSDAEGRFAITGYGASAGAELTIHAAKMGHASASVLARAGDAGLSVVLPRIGFLAGTILVEDDLDVRLKVRVRSAAGDVVLESWPQPRFAVPGSSPGARTFDFMFTELPVGLHTLEILTAGRDAPLHVLREVLVVQEERFLDPRLNPIDLCGALPRVALSVRDARGELLDSAWVSWRGDDGSWSDPTPTLAGRARVPFDGKHVEVKVGAVGYREQSLAPRADQDVVLEPGVPVRLIVAGLDELPSGYAPEVRFDGWSRPLDRGEVRMTLAPGEYSLRLGLQHAAPGGSTAGGAFAPAEPDFTVREGIEEEQVFRFEVSSELLERVQGHLDEGWMSAEEFRRRYGEGGEPVR